MKQAAILIGFFILILQLTSCKSMENSVCPEPVNEEGGNFFTARDGLKIFIREYIPIVNPATSIYLMSGVTGINHYSEREIIDILGSDSNRVIVVHPRGTGYSEGVRGDTDPDEIIKDYCEIVKGDSAYMSGNKRVFLFGHSMSCAFALEVAAKLPFLDGIILVNPPYKLKAAKGMSPGLLDYLNYIAYYVFAPHAPIVNMSGDPSIIMDVADRSESEKRTNDPLLVKYFSVNCMTKSRKIMNAMLLNARQADFPLLLLYGENDNIVDKSGCDQIYSEWFGQNKKYVVIPGGSHGKSTVLGGGEFILNWIGNI